LKRLTLTAPEARGTMVLEDLRGLSESLLVVAEGSVLPARAVSSGIADRSRAVWLIPTPGFQQAVLAAQGTAPGPTALYVLLRGVIAREASEDGVPTLIVDGTRDIEATVAAVEDLFAEALADGPRAESVAERRAVLREANEAIAAQVRACYGRLWAEGDAETAVLEFMCECGDACCDASVHVPVAALSSGAVVAPDHR
jgi:hypothetical protein